MKKLVVLSIALLLSAGSVNSQITKNGLGVSLGTNLFFGDSFISDSRLMPNFEVFSFYQMAPKMTLKLQAGYSKINSKTKNNSFHTMTIIPVEVRGMYSLSSSPTFPFIEAGFGVMNITTRNATNAIEALFVGGVGVNYAIDPKLSFLFSAEFNYTTRDDFNGIQRGFNDGYISFKTGLSFNLGADKEKNNQDALPKSDHLAELPQAKTSKSTQLSDVYTDLIRLRSRIETLEMEIEAKNARIEELAVMIQTKNEEINGLETQIASLDEPKELEQVSEPEVELVNDVHKETVNSQMAVDDQKESTKLNENQAMQRYDVAITNFNNRNYRAAILGLTDLTENNPAHLLASNFAYWIGESYFALNDYEPALESFSSVTKFEKSTKFDYALYMAGRCYVKLENTDMAVQKFQELVQKYPNSVLADKAAKRLEALQPKVIS